MNPKTYRITNITIKAFILLFAIMTTYFIFYYATVVINWIEVAKIFDYGLEIWTAIIMLAGFCCGIVCMWLFYNPDSAWIVSRMDNPAAMAYIFTLMIIKIRVLKWKKYFKDIDFNFIRGE